MSKKINDYHKRLLDEIERLSVVEPFNSKHSASYGGHSEKTHPLSNAQLRKIVKDWAKEHKGLSFDEYIDLLNSIYTQSGSDTEKRVGGYIISSFPKFRSGIDPQLLDRWLEYLNGWSQVDSLCQSNFEAADLLANWEAWKKVLVDFNHSTNISKRRASLVLLTRPLWKSEDSRLEKLALKNIDRLKSERDILITKAISWLLRDMIKLHRQAVSDYLEKNKATLPRIAVREVTRKLETGMK